MLRKTVLFLSLSGILSFIGIIENSMATEQISNPLSLRIGYQASILQKHDIDGSLKLHPTAQSVIEATSPSYSGDYKKNFLGGSLGFGVMAPNNTMWELELAGHSKFLINTQTKDEYFSLDDGANLAIKNSGLEMGLLSINLYYNMGNTSDKVVPYVGGGFGIAQTKLELSSTESQTNYPMLLQFKAGLKVNSYKYLPLYLGYSLLYITKHQLVGSFDTWSVQGGSGFALGPIVQNKKINITYLFHNFDIGLIFSQNTSKT